MNIKPKIEKIQSQIAVISEKLPETKAFGDFVTRAIVASAGRAALWESRLSTAARLTVASSAMDYVSYILSYCDDYSEVTDNLNLLVDYAAEFAPLQLAEHKREDGVEAPFLWTGDEGGPFIYSDNNYPLRIVQRPHLPGGNWSLLYSNIPVSFAETALDAADKACAFIELRESAFAKSRSVDINLRNN